MPSLLVLLMLSSLYAQSPEQPAKEESHDLRNNQLTIFRIEEVKTGKIYQLERNVLLDHYLKLTNGNDEELRKVDTRDAKKLDMDFAGRFIRIQYEIPSVDGACKVTHRLAMKGDEQEVCEKDEKKSQEVASFLQELAKRF